MADTARGVPPVEWIGTAWFGPWWLAYRGPVGVTATHAHHAVQLVIGSTVVLSVDGERRAAPTIVPPDVPHRILVGDRDATLVYVDGDLARALGPDPPDWSTVPVLDSWSSASAIAAVVCPAATAPRSDTPVVAAAQAALADPDDGRTIGELARDLGLSPSRLSHAFTESVGTSMRTYRRWQRLLLAAEAVAGGAGLTEAAHSSGFADGPHLARTFRRHFGLSVRELTAGIRWSTR